MTPYSSVLIDNYTLVRCVESNDYSDNTSDNTSDFIQIVKSKPIDSYNLESNQYSLVSYIPSNYNWWKYYVYDNIKPYIISSKLYSYLNQQYIKKIRNLACSRLNNKSLILYNPDIHAYSNKYFDVSRSNTTINPVISFQEQNPEQNPEQPIIHNTTRTDDSTRNMVGFYIQFYVKYSINSADDYMYYVHKYNTDYKSFETDNTTNSNVYFSDYLYSECYDCTWIKHNHQIDDNNKHMVKYMVNTNLRFHKILTFVSYYDDNTYDETQFKKTFMLLDEDSSSLDPVTTNNEIIKIFNTDNYQYLLTSKYFGPHDKNHKTSYVIQLLMYSDTQDGLHNMITNMIYECYDELKYYLIPLWNIDKMSYLNRIIKYCLLKVNKIDLYTENII
jgi:hypothetical protein